MGYPALNTLSTVELLRTAEQYLECGDLGAALYYGLFALVVGDERMNTGLSDADNREWNRYFMRALRVVSVADSRAGSELECALDNAGVQLNEKNRAVLMREHLPHWSTFEKLYELCNEYSLR